MPTQNEKPIMFLPEMVRAILDGRKTQTRRVVNFKKIAAKTGIKKGILFYSQTFNSWGIDGGGVVDITLIDCPYGKVGDRLWVRETFCYAKMYGYDARSDGGEFWYKATDSGQCEGPYKSSRFMPKVAARIWLEITNVRVQRVQDITQEEIVAEGLWSYSAEYRNEICIYRDSVYGIHSTRIKFFKQLWDSINAKRGYSWESNPWVWVIEFKVCK